MKKTDRHKDRKKSKNVKQNIDELFYRVNLAEVKGSFSKDMKSPLPRDRASFSPLLRVQRALRFPRHAMQLVIGLKCLKRACKQIPMATLTVFKTPCMYRIL